MVSRMKRLRLVVLVVIGVGAMMLAAPRAGAQIEEAVKPPRVEQPAQPPRWLYYLVGIGVIAVCVGLSVFPGRRSHED